MRKLSVTQRKWLLAIHLLFSAIMFGVAVVFLVLSITIANTNDKEIISACYSTMHLLSMTAGRYSTIATLVTGVLLSVLTQWGLFKFYWIIVKEGLTFLSILLGPIGMYVWTLKAVTLISVEGASAIQESAFIVNSNQLWTGIILQIISITAMFILSVFKPWGPRKQRNNKSPVPS